ncbi:MAG: RNA polymerase sigma factor RpoH [Pseudomonadota bacterium]
MTEKIKTLPQNLPVVAVNQDGFYRYLQEINSIPSLTHEEEFMLSKAFLEKSDIEAAHRLVTSHLKLVAKIALSYRNYGLPVVDLVSEGNLGLMQAVKKYNPDLGFRLSTYAMWWIKASIQEYVLRSWSLVKVGTTAAQKKLFFSLNKIKTKLSNLYARQLGAQDIPQIAEELGVSTKEVTEMSARLAGGDLSLNAQTSHEENSRELIELLPESRPSQELVLSQRQENNSKHTLLSKAMLTLNDRELSILKARKLREEPATLNELSQEFNISKERVRQIENRAFDKVQSYMLTAV